MCTKEFKSTKAITLVTLVISILVILILSGISISMFTGENGIIGKAIKSKELMEIETEKEKIQLAVGSAIIEDNDYELKFENLQKELEIQGIVKKDHNIDEYLVKVPDGWKLKVHRNYIIDRKGNVEKLGTGMALRKKVKFII